VASRRGRAHPGTSAAERTTATTEQLGKQIAGIAAELEIGRARLRAAGEAIAAGPETPTTEPRWHFRLTVGINLPAIETTALLVVRQQRVGRRHILEPRQRSRVVRMRVGMI